MSVRAESRRERMKDSLRFWAVVAVVCGLVGLGAYAFGKGWLGSKLHEMEVRAGAPEISAEHSVREAGGEGSSEQSPPVKPVIMVQEREPSGRERRQAERELAAREPQDGAQLHAREDERSERERERPDREEPGEAEAGPPAEAERPPEPSAASPPPSTTQRYVVTAGSFADERNARSVRQGLIAQGYQPYITTVERDGVTFRRVNVAVFGTREQAEQLQATLKSQGFDSAVWPG